MKLKKLIIHNIASIEDAEIDFEHGPLAEDSRFLICGPTGTGKTTILDCISLALYGTTPRLKAAANEKYVDENESFALNSSQDSIGIDDSRMLIRRGALNAWVELYFTDKDDVPLKAVWSCHRAHNHADGNIKKPEWLLHDEHDVVLTSKLTETKKTIEERLGLTFEQFCRTTLLAQGDFTKFLKSGEGEKAEILEKLTGTEIYTAISKQIYECYTDKKNERDAVQAKMGGVQLLTDEERAALLQQQEELQQQLTRLTQEETHWNRCVTWWQRNAELQKQLEDAARKEAEAKARLDTEAFRNEEQLLHDWNVSAEPREWLKQQKQQERLRAEKKAEEGELRAQYLRNLGGYLELQQRHRQQQKELRQCQDFLTGQAGRKELYEQVSLIGTLLRQEKQHRQTLTDAAHRLQQLQTAWTQGNAALAQLQAQSQQAGQAEDEQRKAYEAQQQTLAGMNYDEVLSRQKTASEKKDALAGYERLLENDRQSQQRYQEYAEAYADQKTQSGQYLKTAEEAQLREQQVEKDVQTQQEIYSRQKLACEDLIKEYRSQLAVGDVCPLCGQKIERLATDAHFQSVLQPLEQHLEELRRQKETVHKEWVTAHTQYETCTRQAAATLQKLQAADAERQRSSKALHEHLLYSRYAESGQPEELIAQDKAKIGQILTSLAATLQTIGECQSRVEQLRAAWDRLVRAAQTAQKRVTDQEKQQTQLKEQMRGEDEAAGRARQALAEVEAQLAQWVTPERRQEAGDRFLPQLQAAAAKYSREKERLQTLEKDLAQLDGELQHIHTVREEICSQHPDWQRMEPVEVRYLPNLVSGWSDLQNRVSSNAGARLQIQQRLEELGQALQGYLGQDGALSLGRLEELMPQAWEEIETLRVHHQQCKDEVVAVKARREHAGQEFRLLQASRPEMDEEVHAGQAVARQQELKAQLTACNQTFGQNGQQLRQDDDNRKKLEGIQRELEAAETELNRWGRLYTLLGSSDGKKFRNIAQSYVLTQLLHGANQYLRQFTDRYEMTCQPGSLTILLRDLEAGGVARPTPTLSGGESFLISLSLALGLSSLSRATVSMDTLFIDEGFGTLDGTYLSAVMDALERLHQMGGKRVGLISHVESLRDRITTQIQLSRVNSTLSRVEVKSLL